MRKSETSSILLTGVSGQVGLELTRTLAPLGRVVGLSRAELDLADGESIRRAVRSIQPRWIVHPGAYTAVDKAESEPAMAHAINAEASGILGEEALKLGAAVVTFSTDYVFNGSGDRPWRETDATGPLGVYGATKLAGEQALAASGASHLVFRTSWVYSAHGKNFVRTMLRLAAERPALTVIDDQHGAPTSARDLARMTAHVLGLIEGTGIEGTEGAGFGGTSSDGNGTGGGDQTAGELTRPFSGIYHASGQGETTWCGFAREIVQTMRKVKPGQAWAEVTPITTADYKTAAQRPLNSRLDCSKLARTFQWTMPDWRVSLAEVLAELGAAELGTTESAPGLRA